MPKCLPDGLTQNVLNGFTKNPPPPISRHSERRVSAPPAARGGNDHRPSIDPGSEWSHRGDVRGVLDWALSPIMGTGDGPPDLTTTFFALSGWPSKPAP